jgi:hypothetical protein
MTTLKTALQLALEAPERTVSLPVEPHEHIRWDCPLFDDNPEHYGYEKIASHRSGGYSWSYVGVFRRLFDGKLFWWHGCGCSCSDVNDSLPDDLTALPSTGTLLRVLFDFDQYDMSGDEKVAMLRKVVEAL